MEAVLTLPKIQKIQKKQQLNLFTVEINLSKSEPVKLVLKERVSFYNPDIGRFMQEDPDPGKLISPLSFTSKYVGMNNNPVNLIDPFGLFSIGDIDPMYDFKKAIGDGINSINAEMKRAVDNVGDFLEKNRADIVATGVIAVTVVSLGATTPLLLSMAAGSLAYSLAQGDFTVSTLLQGAAGGALGFGVGAVAISAGMFVGGTSGAALATVSGGVMSAVGANIYSELAHGRGLSMEESVAIGILGAGGVLVGYAIATIYFPASPPVSINRMGATSSGTTGGALGGSVGGTNCKGSGSSHWCN